ncbi:MAG: flap endonuclease-1 [Candidatus Nanohaloarchaea archaeon]
MGVNLGDLVERKKIEFADLNDKEIAIDAMNTLYQFLSIIRQRDGTPLKDSSGEVTSHLSGLFYRNINLLESNIRPVYVFDGDAPDLKEKETTKRRKKREEAREEWKRLKEEGKVSEAYSKATQSSKLTGDMVEESKRLLDAMGVPYIQAPSEGEAQTAYMTHEKYPGSIYAAGSQDWDSLLFGAERMVKNLTTRKTRKTSSGGKKEISTELIELKDVLKQLEISRKKLIWMGVLMGTDFNPDGVHGIGPKTALKLVKKYDSWNELFEDDKVDWKFDTDPGRIIEFFNDPPVEDLEYSYGEPDKEKIREILISDHDFSEDRVDSGLEDLDEALSSRQSGLDSFT